MINLISRLWNNFKNQPDTWFFFGFLLTFTLSIRKVLLYFPIQGTFNEYSAIYIYISDIFLFLAITSWCISILCNNLLSLSSIKLWISSDKHKLYIFLPLFLVFLSFISILWSQNVSIAVFRSIKLLEFYLIYIYIIFRIMPQLFHVEQNTSHPNLLFIKKKEQIVPRGTINTSFSLIRRRVGDEVVGSQISWLFFNIIILSGLFQAIIGIIQFFLQKSIGLFWLRESLISPDILGVAKIILNGEKYIRAYGLMPHPNILGGFLLFSIIITILYNRLFHVEQFKNTPHPIPLLIKERVAQNVPRGTIKTPFFFIRRRVGDEVYYRWIFSLILAIQILALILTFSKSAIIGLIIALVFINVPRGTKYTSPNPSPYKGEGGSEYSTPTQTLNVPRGTIKHLKILILSGLIILTSAFIIIKPDINSLFVNSLNERLFYLNVPRGTFESDPVFGLGAGQSVLSMQKYFPQKLEFWQYQPVHNVFLLIFSELGLIVLGLFIWWLWKLLRNTPHPNPCLPDRQALLIKERVAQDVPRGTLSEHGAGAEQKKKEPTPFSLIRRRAGDEVVGKQENNDYILHNYNTNLSSIIISRYFKGILLGLIFIMLFDHYLWDIQQGNLLFWLTAGFVAGINRR